MHPYNTVPNWSWAELVLRVIKKKTPNNLTPQKISIMFIVATSKHNVTSLSYGDLAFVISMLQSTAVGPWEDKGSWFKIISLLRNSVLSCIAELWVCLKLGTSVLQKGLSHSLTADRKQRLLGKGKLLLKTSSGTLQWLQKAVSIKWHF